MTDVQHSSTAVELPPGVRHHSTSTFAESWEAYDVLTAEDGWTESTRYDPETGIPHSWKIAVVSGHTISVHAPKGERPGA